MNLPPKKDAFVRTRLTQALRERLDAIHERYFTSDSKILEELVKEFCAYVENQGKVEPFKLVPKNAPSTAPISISNSPQNSPKSRQSTKINITSQNKA